jgi:hypothetical protein
MQIRLCIRRAYQRIWNDRQQHSRPLADKLSKL